MGLFHRHRHEWDATAVNHFVEHQYALLLGRTVETGRKTQVLRVCVMCGKRDVETLDGAWTLDQVRGLMAPVPPVRSEAP